MSASPWDALRAFLDGKYRLISNDAHAVALRFEQTTTVPAQVQELRIELVQLFGEPWLLLRADLGSQTWPPMVCLARNAEWPGLGLVMIDGRYVLQTAQPLRVTDQADLDRALRFMAHQALLLRKEGISRAADDACDALSHWT